MGNSLHCIIAVLLTLLMDVGQNLSELMKTAEVKKKKVINPVNMAFYC
jgi:hypothetical protein